MRGLAIDIISNGSSEPYRIAITLDSEMKLGPSLSDLAFAMDEDSSELISVLNNYFAVFRTVMLLLIMGLSGSSFEYFTVPPV